MCCQLIKHIFSALKEGIEARVGAIVVLAHMHYKDENVDIILNGIRGYSWAFPRLATIPVQFLTGHSHMRGQTAVDNYSSSFEAGHYLDTLGWASFDLLPSSPVESAAVASPLDRDHPPVEFHFEYVEAHRASLSEFAGVRVDELDTKEGRELSEAIHAAYAQLNLSIVIACPRMQYYQDATIDRADSLYRIYLESVIPAILRNSSSNSHPNEAWYLCGVGSLRYDVYPGRFLYNDVFSVAPFANQFLYYPSLPGSKIQNILQLMINSTDPIYKSLPSYIGGPGILVESKMYDLFLDDFSSPILVPIIALVAQLDPVVVKAKLVPWRGDRSAPDFVDTTLIWAQEAPKLWPCKDTIDVY